MQIQPLQNNLLIHMCQLDEPRENIIALPDHVRPEDIARYPYGDVISCGPDCKFISPGDKILFLAGNAIGFEHPTTPVYILPESCVLARYIPDETPSILS